MIDDLPLLHAVNQPIDVYHCWLLLPRFDVAKLFAFLQVFVVKHNNVSRGASK